MQLETPVSRELIFPDLPAFDVSTVLRAFAARVVATGRLQDAEALYRALWEREQLGSTGVGQGVAVPHCKMENLDRVLLAVGNVPQGVDYASVDGRPVHLFFLVISPASEPAAHLRCLADISKWVQKSGRVEELWSAVDPDEVLAALGQEP